MLQLPADTHQVWEPPQTWSDVSNATLNAILDEIERGIFDEDGHPTGHRYSANNAARKRAVWAVLKRHLPSKTDAQQREIVLTWLKNGVLEDREYENPDRKETLKGLYVNAAKRPGKESPE